MLNFSTWKITTIIGACLMGFWFTAPNFLNDDQLVDLPDWMPKQQINLGLDLQGGVHLLWEVDIEGVNEQELVQLRATVPDVLRDAGVRRFKRPVIRNDAVQVRISDSAKVDQAVDALEEFSQPVNTALGTFETFTVDASGNTIEMRYTDEALLQRQSEVLARSIEIIRRRIDEMGTQEPTIQR